MDDNIYDSAANRVVEVYKKILHYHVKHPIDPIKELTQ